MDRYLQTHSRIGEDEVRYSAVSQKYKDRFESGDSAVTDRYMYTAYGTTLLLAVSIGNQVLLMQIGDGTCVILQRDGTFSVPVPAEEENFLNVTVSMCDQDAFSKIRHTVIDCDPELPSLPAAIFLSTDGVDDCFPIYRNRPVKAMKIWSKAAGNLNLKSYSQWLCWAYLLSPGPTFLATLPVIHCVPAKSRSGEPR